MTTNLSNAKANEIVASWGWFKAPQSVLQMAELSQVLVGMKSGEALIFLNKLDKRSLNELLEEKARVDKLGSIKFLEFAAQRLPQIRSSIDRILTLRRGVAFYDNLEVMKPHHCLSSSTVNQKCEALDAVVMEIEGEKPVVIFSTYHAMLAYDTSGRQDKALDPIRAALVNSNPDETILVAVSNRSDVAKILHETKSFSLDRTVATTETLWHATSCTEDYQRALARLLDTAIEAEATDLDIDPISTGGCNNFMRRHVDLVRMSLPTFDETTYRHIVNFLMQRSSANPTNARLQAPADGQLTYRSSIADVFLRLSFIPLNHPGSETNLISVAIRILPRTDDIVDLANLNIHDARVRQEIAMAARLDSGLILFCGATGSGKSTLCAAALGENIQYYGDTKKRISVENPIERYLNGVKQVNVFEGVKDGKPVNNFSEILRALKRHDPDVIWVGEVRDRDSAETCVASSITGHLVMSSIHANHTLIGYDHLAKMVGADHRYQLVESLSLIVAQRIVKRLCPKCAQISEPTEDERHLFAVKLRGEYQLSLAVPERVYRASKHGCEECKGSGFIGLQPINEVLPVTYEAKVAMLKMLNGENALQDLYQARLVTMFESAMKLVESGHITLGAALS